MANASTKAMSSDEWLKEKGKDGTLTFVSGTNGANDDKVAWSDTDPSAPHAGVNSGGQTYRQGTIHNIGGSQYESGGSAIYDGAQNLIGYVAGDGTVFRTGQDKDGRLTVDSEGLSDYDRQYLQSAADRLREEGALSGMSAQEVVDQMNANKAGGRLSSGEIAAREAEKAYALSAEGGGAWTNPNYAGRDEDGGEKRDYAEELRSLLKQWRTAAENQQTAQIDNAVEQSMRELQQALDEAGEYYQRQQEQISAGEMAQRDNTALYAELRGDKGGIGRAQYDSAASAAAINRQTAAAAQTRIAADTKRQISSLRAQGEFRKADALLQTAQTYLAKLMELEKWAGEYSLSTERFQQSVSQWQAEFSSKMQQYGREQAESQAREKASSLAAAGNALLKAGIMPSAAQLEAMGMDETQAQAYIMAKQLS